MPLAIWALATLLGALGPVGQTPIQAANDLDAFMARVLERRNENWRILHDYILSERERFELRGPGERRLYGARRDYAWYVRDGYLIRSPVRYDGVEIGEGQRREYEQRWLESEKRRESKQRERGSAGSETDEADSTDLSPSDDGDGASPAESRSTLEPRFISEAYFLRFKFEPGNYYLVAREQLAGRNVLRIEYYPKRLFSDDGEQNRESKPSGKDMEFERKFNKVAVVTMWVDPAEHQIVKYTFENVNLDFLPGRTIVRVDDITASMVMSQPIQGVWLPEAITVTGGVTLANGSFDAIYERQFLEYRQGEVKARIRYYAPMEPQ